MKNKPNRLGDILYQEGHEFYLLKYCEKFYIEEYRGRHTTLTYGPLSDEQSKVFRELCSMKPLDWKASLKLSLDEIKLRNGK